MQNVVRGKIRIAQPRKNVTILLFVTARDTLLDIYTAQQILCVVNINIYFIYFGVYIPDIAGMKTRAGGDEGQRC
jgi:hypothetical protein